MGKKSSNSAFSHISTVVMRNRYLYNGEPARRNRVNVEHWVGKVNVGDQISLPIVEWTKHLLALGSIIGCGHFDAAVWGSGVNTPLATYRTGRRRNRVKLDIRALRGPLTRSALESFGYDCSRIQGIRYLPFPDGEGDKGALSAVPFHQREYK